MTTLDFSSTAESSMDDASNHPQTITKPRSQKTTSASTATATAINRFVTLFDEELDEDNSNVGVDPKVWGNFTESFRQVQSVLDRNRLLIQQVNENHRSKIHESMVKNVALIQEINQNVAKVVSLYSDLSTNFSGVFHQRNPGTDDAKKKTGEGNKN